MLEKSQHLANILRHNPEIINLKLTQEGWANVSDLVASGHFTEEELHKIVAFDPKKKRFVFSHDGTQIRACQGHSTKQVKLTFKKAIPPTILYHGSVNSATHRIMKEGLLPMKRHHVHMSASKEVAQDVGSRRKGKVVIYQIDAKKMLADGFTFYRSENGVWLTDIVEPQYLTIL